MAKDGGEKTEGDAKAKKGGKGKLIIGLVLVIVIGGGAFMFLGQGKKSDAAELPPCPFPQGTTTTIAPPTDCELPPPPEEGPVAQMAPITLSLADGGMVRVAVALQLAAGGDAKLFAEENEGAKALDQTVAVLSTKTAAELAPGEPRDHVKEELSEHVVEAYTKGTGASATKAVLEVYFTEFVLQPAS